MSERPATEPTTGSPGDAARHGHHDEHRVVVPLREAAGPEAWRGWPVLRVLGVCALAGAVVHLTGLTLG